MSVGLLKVGLIHVNKLQVSIFLNPPPKKKKKKRKTVCIHQLFSGTVSLSFSPKFCKLECNTASDWLNRMV